MNHDFLKVEVEKPSRLLVLKQARPFFQFAFAGCLTFNTSNRYMKSRISKISLKRQYVVVDPQT